MNETTLILERIDVLERKLDRLLGYLFEVIDQSAGSPRPVGSGGTTARPSGTASSDSEQSVDSTRVFEVNLDAKNKFDFRPKDKWSYRVGSRVQWISKTGRFSIRIQNHDELPSPFDGKREIRASQDPEGNWRTPSVPVTPIYSETEDLARTLAGAKDIQFRYVVALEKGGQIYTDDNQVGARC